MIRHLSREDWLRARKDLAAIIDDARQDRITLIEPLLVRAQRALTVEGSPTLAGSQLETIADQLKGAPGLRDRISELSSRLSGFAFAQVDKTHLVTPARSL